MPIEPERRWFAPNGAPTAVLHIGAPAPRPATMKDLYDHLVIAEHLPHIDALNMPLWPTDIPMTTIHTEAMAAWAANCVKPFSMAGYGVMATADVIRMLEIVTGGADALSRRPPFSESSTPPARLPPTGSRSRGSRSFPNPGFRSSSGPRPWQGLRHR